MKALVPSIVIASLVAALAVRWPPQVETGLAGMIDAADGSIAGIAAATALEGRLVAVGASEAEARDLLERFVSECEGSASANPVEDMKLLEGRTAGLLAARTADLLEKGDFEAVYEEALARIYSVSAPLFAVGGDPFGFAGEWAMSQIGGGGLWHRSLGISSCERDGKGYAVALRKYDSIEAAAADLKRIPPGSGIYPGAAAFHSASAVSRSVPEINILGSLGLLTALLIGWWLFGDFRFALPLVLVMGVGAAAAAAAVFLAWPKPHVVTFLFGTTLAGLGVDYVYHSRAEGRRANSALLKSLATTVVSFAPLLLSSAVALRQMALWSIAGLAAMAAVLILSRRDEGSIPSRQPSTPGRSRLPRFALWIAALAALAGLPFADFKSDASSMYTPSALLAEGERIASQIGGVMPPRETQRRNAFLKESFAKAMGVRWMEDTGIHVEGRDKSIFDPKGEIDSMFRDAQREAARLLWAAFAALAALLLAIYRRRALKIAAPVAASLALTLGSLGWICLFTGGGINFFETVCLFIVAGLGLDYAIFAETGDRTSRRAVIASALTSIAAFAFLAMTSFAVTRAMGITLAIGLMWSLLMALSLGGGRKAKTDGGAWYDQSEQSAGTLRIALLWWVYRILGKSACKVLVAFVVAFIFPFAAPARRALREYYAVLGVKASWWRLYRHILSFAWGMLDKTDACTLKRALPKMEVREDDSWRRFDSLLRSGKGAFIIGSHLGTIEVLPALAKATGFSPKVHAFQQMGHDATFTRMFMRHFDPSSLELHAVEDIGVETAAQMQDAIADGALVIMSGDRLSASNPRAALKAGFLGRVCLWPKGVFVFAKVLEAPVFFVTCLRTGFNRYEVHVREGDRLRLLEGYVSFLEEEVKSHPGEWFQFYRFFLPFPASCGKLLA